MRIIIIYNKLTLLVPMCLAEPFYRRPIVEEIYFLDL